MGIIKELISSETKSSGYATVTIYKLVNTELSIWCERNNVFKGHLLSFLIESFLRSCNSVDDIEVQAKKVISEVKNGIE